MFYIKERMKLLGGRMRKKSGKTEAGVGGGSAVEGHLVQHEDTPAAPESGNASLPLGLDMVAHGTFSASEAGTWSLP